MSAVLHAAYHHCEIYMLLPRRPFPTGTLAPYADYLQTPGTALEVMMKALVYHGRGDIRCDTVPDPKIEDGRDAIIKVTACAICGSDLHLMGGFVPEMKSGDVLGHECMGEVVEVRTRKQTTESG
jgi:hypothetical protein